MKIVEINSVLNGSTGKIARQIAEKAVNHGHEVMLCVPRGRHNKPIRTDYRINLFGNQLSEDMHILLSRFTGYNGCFSMLATKSLLKDISNFNPDVLHLHNLHNSYINLPLLFSFIKKTSIPVVWTLHDCWAFTGQCPYFTLSKCDKWETGCNNCLQYKQYPSTMFDNTKTMWNLKKKWFTGIDNMTIVTPSQWLADLVKQSYLKDYPVKVINNGIDLTIFKPTNSDFRVKYNIGNKTILLGVAFMWGRRKGLDVFIELAKRLDGEKYQIVLVGTNSKINKILPDNIISINRTNSQQELAEIYTSANIFINPTREENYPTVNIEALACGTPVVTFNTGGSPEIINDTCGRVVECDNIKKLLETIKDVDSSEMTTHCINQARLCDSQSKFAQYIDLYCQLLK